MSGSIHFRGVNGALVFYNLQTNEDVMTINPDGTITAPGLSGVSGESFLHQATVPLTDAQIKALPTTPFVLLPPTVTLGYSGAPARLQIPVHTNLILDTRAGGYTNINGLFRLQLAYGSDWSDDATGFDFCGDKFFTARLSMLWMQHPKFAVLMNSPIAGQSRAMIDNIHLDDNFEDDALVLSCYNDQDGNLTDGHASNTLIVSMLYLTLNLTTGLYE